MKSPDDIIYTLIYRNHVRLLGTIKWYFELERVVREIRDVVKETI